MNNYKKDTNGQEIETYGQTARISPKRQTMKITNIQLPAEVVDEVSPIQRTIVDRRESKTSIISKLIHNANLKKERKFTRDSFVLKKVDSKPPLLKTHSLKKDNSVESAKKMNLSVDISLVSNGSEGKKVMDKSLNKSMNSSMNEIDYTNNFKNLVESIESDIKERLRLKIVPYSGSKRKKLQKRIERDISLLTKLMMTRKPTFKPA